MNILECSLVILLSAPQFQIQCLYSLGLCAYYWGRLSLFLLTGLETGTYNCQKLEPKGFPPFRWGLVLASWKNGFFLAFNQTNEAFYHVKPKFENELESKKFPGYLREDTDINGFITQSGTLLTRSRTKDDQYEYLADRKQINFSDTKGLLLSISPGNRTWPPFIWLNLLDIYPDLLHNLGGYYIRIDKLRSFEWIFPPPQTGIDGKRLLFIYQIIWLSINGVSL